MALNRETKVQIAATVREKFDRSVAALLVDFSGVNVDIVTELRARFRKAGIEYKVVKNNIVQKALIGTPYEGQSLDKGLIGNTGIAWSYEDPSAAAKILKQFRKEKEEKAEKLVVKAGILDNQVFLGAAVENDFAALPGKNEVRSMLLAQLLAPAQSLVRQLTAPGQNLAFALDARRRQLENG